MLLADGLHISQGVLIAIALVLFILCAAAWLIGARPWNRP